MKMTVYFDGTFWCALIEYSDTKQHYRAFRYVFGKEPKTADIITFIGKDLTIWMKRQEEISPATSILEIQSSSKKKNPKRMQRELNRAKKQPIVSTKAQLALQKTHDLVKQKRKTAKKKKQRALATYKYQLKQEKRHQKRKGIKPTKKLDPI